MRVVSLDLAAGLGALVGLLGSIPDPFMVQRGYLGARGDPEEAFQPREIASHPHGALVLLPVQGEGAGVDDPLDYLKQVMFNVFLCRSASGF